MWHVVDTAGFEAAWVTEDGQSMQVIGQAVGQLPEPYSLNYQLTVDADLVTRRLTVSAQPAGPRRELSLVHEGGTWRVNGQLRPDLSGALDCDLAASPFTNTMPVRRQGLLTGGEERFLMAYVEVPSLRVVASWQRYTHLRETTRGHLVRFDSDDFTADVTFDDDGYVLDYPTIAHRVTAEAAVVRPD